MKKLLILISFLIFSVTYTLVLASPLPAGFVYLRTVDPSIQQEMRYAGYHNFIGHPLPGYEAAECILTQEAAHALKQVQQQLLSQGLSLKVYDCYRPQRTVDYFVTWSKNIQQQQMKKEFYPRVNKADFFKLGYVAAKSGHTRGSTVDLTIIPRNSHSAKYNSEQVLIACYAPYNKRFKDNSIDMGTGFDCMDELSHPLNKKISGKQYQNRMLLRNLMTKYGFKPIPEEWWHFTLQNEPYKDTYFNFPMNHAIP